MKNWDNVLLVGGFVSSLVAAFCNNCEDCMELGFKKLQNYPDMEILKLICRYGTETFLVQNFNNSIMRLHYINILLAYSLQMTHQ